MFRSCLFCIVLIIVLKKDSCLILTSSWKWKVSQFKASAHFLSVDILRFKNTYHACIIWLLRLIGGLVKSMDLTQYFFVFCTWKHAPKINRNFTELRLVCFLYRKTCPTEKSIAILSRLHIGSTCAELIRSVAVHKYCGRLFFIRPGTPAVTRYSYPLH